MLRRDFIKAFGAFTAALSAGVRMPSGAEAKSALPAPSLPATKPSAAAEPLAEAMSAQEQVMAMLADCDVVRVEQMQTLGGLTRVKVSYEMDKVFGRQVVHLNKEAKALTDGKRPVEIVVHATGREFDIDTVHFGKHLIEPIYEIEVTWA